jgi:hypothetical protein
MRTRLLSALALAAGLAVATTAQAQPRWGGSAQPGYGGGYDVQQTAYENGYRDGLTVGQRDAQSGRRYSADDNGLYRDGERGYDRHLGSRGQYKQIYRRGFEQGYRESYFGRGGRTIPRAPDYGGYPRGSTYPDNSRYPSGGYGRYGGYGYRSPAFDKGYSDGYEKGLDDGRDRDRFDPVRQKWYRSGDRGYERSYGSKDAYRNQYRDAFRQGYERGYQDGGRVNRRSNGGFRWPW